MKIYISPANHDKKYIIKDSATGKNYTEKQQCEIIAKYVIEALSAYQNVTAYYPKVFSTSEDYQGRPQEAKKLGCDLYIAIHTNGAGNGKEPLPGPEAMGSVGYYYPSAENMAIKKAGGKDAKAVPEDASKNKSYAMALSLTKKLDGICPVKSNRSNQPPIVDGINNTQYSVGVGFGEIREPANLGMTPVLIECNFHSYQYTAEWIVKSTSEIARAIVDSIAEIFNLQKGDTPMATAIKIGDKGDAVKEVQNLLNQKGYDCGTADGIFGTKTEASVKAFQKANGLTVDGVVGDKTLAALKTQTEPPKQSNAEIAAKLEVIISELNGIVKELKNM